MSILLNGDCLEELKEIEKESIDLIFCDLPYGCTKCKWDKKIDLEEFWNQIMRVKKLHTPIFMTTTTKFGVDLICSAPKKCPFRYDIVWVKSHSTSFLLSKKMPMRKHEMIYVFYEKIPYYDISSHKYKFSKEDKKLRTDEGCDALYGKETGKVMIYDKDGKTRNAEPRYDPPLPVSVVKEVIRKDKHNTAYGEKIHYHNNNQKNGESIYDPPLPNSMLEIKSSRGKHSTEKPVALIEWILKYYSKPGDVILDPTMGSGSAGVACVNMNRNFIGIELNEEIYEVAVNRIEK